MVDASFGRRVRDLLLEVGFLEALRSESDTDRLRLAPSSDMSRVEAIVRSFVYGVATAKDAFAAAVGPIDPETWVRMRLVRVDGDMVYPLIRIRPHEGLLLAYDEARHDREVAADLVMPYGPSSASLALVTIRDEVGTTLDLGTGCGVHALLARRHSASVTATDVNPRALEFTTFNAGLNELDPIEVLEGSLYEPVGDRRFDLIVSNPPWVISPSRKYVYRDGGLESDEVTASVVRGASRHLNDGGYCQILCNWAHIEGLQTVERIADWAAGSECDVFVIADETLDPAMYVARWLRDTEPGDQKRFGERFDEWMRYLEEHRIQAVTFGLITMRRRATEENWLTVEQERGNLRSFSGEQIVAEFRARDLAEQLSDDDALLHAHLSAVPGLTLHEVSELKSLDWFPTKLEVRTADGGRVGDLDPVMAQTLGLFDGAGSVHEVLDRLAERVGMSRTDVNERAIPILRRMIRSGFLVKPPV